MPTDQKSEWQLPFGYTADILNQEVRLPSGRYGDFKYGAKYAYRGVPVKVSHYINDEQYWVIQLSYWSFEKNDWVIADPNLPVVMSWRDLADTLDPIFDKFIGKKVWKWS